jgi:alpha-ketoglutarate-dependent taurine dioxygenase
VIAFLCLQQALRGGDNFVVSAITLYNELLSTRPDLVEVLMEPFYYQRHNVDPANPSAYYQQPVFSIYQGHFAAQLLRVLIDRAYQSGDVPPMTDLQREALDALDTMAEDSTIHVRFRQRPGDMVLMNNMVTLHRRSEFEDDDDPTRKRHLLRLWLATPNSRPLDPMYAASYGETAAGAVRGGMRT